MLTVDPHTILPAHEAWTGFRYALSVYWVLWNVGALNILRSSNPRQLSRHSRGACLFAAYVQQPAGALRDTPGWYSKVVGT